MDKLLEARIDARKATQNAYEAYKSCREAEELLNAEVGQKLAELGLREAKTADGKYTGYIKQTTKVNVTDPEAVRTWLTKNGFDERQYFTLNKTAYTGIAKVALKTHGEVPDGTEFETTESFVVRENK